MEHIWKIAQIPWVIDGRGNHRIVVTVDKASKYCRTVIFWRRRDQYPDKCALQIRLIDDDRRIINVKSVQCSRIWGEIVFEAPQAGKYAIYYLPYKRNGSEYFPIMDYSSSIVPKPDSLWLKNIPDECPTAEVDYIESRTAYDSYYPMEVIASAEEVDRCRDTDKPYIVFTEDRLNPIRMKYELPYKYIEHGFSKNFSGEANPNEYYVFQIGVKSYTKIPVAVDYEVARNTMNITADNLTCFNLGGKDWKGEEFRKCLTVNAGEVQPLWIGVDIPAEVQSELNFAVILSLGTDIEKIEVKLNISGSNIEYRGDADLWRLSRLRWLNSDAGIDCETTEPFPPLKYGEVRSTVRSLGHDFVMGNLMVNDIRSYFNEGIKLTDEAESILSNPIEFSICSKDKKMDFTPVSKQAELTGSGLFQSKSVAKADNLTMTVDITVEYDGHVETFVTIVSQEDDEINVSLMLNVKEKYARYMMGMGCEGGYMPNEWNYKWQPDRPNNFMWLSGVNGGIHLKLKHTYDVWELYTYEKCGLPESWWNKGNGGCRITKTDSGAQIDAYTGKMELKSGTPVTFRFSMQATPIFELDSDRHWQTRYYHGGVPDMQKLSGSGVTVCNIHQGNELNKYINYPFAKDRDVAEIAKKLHEMGIKAKLYYTVRELSTVASEFWAFKSLGNEIFLEGRGFHVADHFETVFENQDNSNPSTGGPWICEHIVDGCVPAWQTVLSNGDYDCSVATSGLSRLHNYYIKGLEWLVQQMDIDGIYLDGVGYDRQIMKRVRKILNTKKGCLIDFHSGNNFHPSYGLCNVLGQYMELMPSVDSLWIGEGFLYEEVSDDYWFMEVTGIPLGLMGDMLHGGGNPWRGMVYGMTARMNWGVRNPQSLWHLWDAFGMKGTSMLGYWDKRCPVTAGNDKIRCTAYMQSDRMMVAVASWAEEDEQIKLNFDWENIGFNPAVCRIEVPYIKDFQQQEEFTPDKKITISSRKGKIIILYCQN